jgi:hypothetical protein
MPRHIYMKFHENLFNHSNDNKGDTHTDIYTDTEIHGHAHRKAVL